MRVIAGAEFSDWYDRKSLEGYELRDCFFLNCTIPRPVSPEARTVLRDVTIRNAKYRSCSISGAVLENIHVSGLGRIGSLPLFLSGTAFRHVTLEGKLSMIMINTRLGALEDEPDQPAWDQANRAFYESVDWALDISRAEFQGGFKVDAVPGHLVLRDEETQVLVSREKFQQIDWRSLDWDGSAFHIAIDLFLKYGLYDETVLVAPRRSKNFRDDLRTFEMLRRERLAV